MIPIRKKAPPNALSQYNRDPNASFDNMPSAIKDELRQSLLAEQGRICCYCMSRVSFQGSRIEHWLCQEDHSDQELKYNNMMLACHGNEGQPPEKQHCDVKKRNLPLKFNPSNQNHQRQLKIRYLRDGSIESGDTDFNAELENVLNLNLAVLKENRKNIYEAIIKALSKKGWNFRTINELIQKNRPSSQGRAEPFCGVALYHLEKWQHKAFANK